MNFLGSNTLLLSQKTLDYLWLRETVINDNLANVDTPGFQSRYVTFEDELKRKMENTKRITRSSARENILKSRVGIHVNDNEITRLDGSNVNADVESADLAISGIKYEFMLEAFNSDMSRLRSVIRGQ